MKTESPIFLHRAGTWLARAMGVLIGVHLCAVGGCRMGSHVYVWTPPEIQSAVGARIAIHEIVGEDQLAAKIHEQMLVSAPKDAGRSLTIIDSKSLAPKSAIQLVSAIDDGVNDVALASVARREGYDYILRGEILRDRHGTWDPQEQLTVSWSLLSLDPVNRGTTAGQVNGKPIVINAKAAIERYPDLAILPDQETLLAAAVARESYRLITPAIQKQRVQLAIGYLTPGSEQVRRGNALAMAMRWGEAAAVWEQVLEDHPGNAAAQHNLAVAAVAAQDFSRAKTIIRDLIRRRPTELHRNTLAWIELCQRDYHRAFNLPDPPEGWFITSGQTSTPNAK